MAVIEMRDSDPSSQSGDRSIHVINYATQSLCLIFMTFFFSLRVYGRLRILNGFAVEDCKSVRRI
jgi:hypothetical protein